MRQLVNPAKALRTLRKGPAILEALLAGVTQEQAMSLSDGGDGWSVLYIVCHMRDVEAIFAQRARDLLDHPSPTFQVTPNEELIARGNYVAQDLRAALASYKAQRAAFIAMLEPLSDGQWLLAGTHPEQGPATLLDVAINSGLHDVDHQEQIIRCLAPIRGA
nr:DinB family protein [Oscillochloris sp. ZM17-4]